MERTKSTVFQGRIGINTGTMLVAIWEVSPDLIIP